MLPSNDSIGGVPDSDMFVAGSPSSVSPFVLTKKRAHSKHALENGSMDEEADGSAPERHVKQPKTKGKGKGVSKDVSKGGCRK